MPSPELRAIGKALLPPVLHPVYKKLRLQRLWIGAIWRHGPRSPVEFFCNICKRRTSWPLQDIGRETPSCTRCGSTVRFRALLHAVSTNALGSDTPEIEPAQPRRGIGFSDDHIYAAEIARNADYINTWFDRPPQRDVTNPASFQGDHYDFAVCSEVLEHVSQPVKNAFDALYDILEPGGTLILSVPMTNVATVEHYPALASWRILQVNGKWRLEGITKEGKPFASDDVVFHGGPGTTVEMRIFGRDDVRSHLEEAGFLAIYEHFDDAPEIGIFWSSVPETLEIGDAVLRGMRSGIWSARKPNSPL